MLRRSGLDWRQQEHAARREVLLDSLDTPARSACLGEQVDVLIAGKLLAGERLFGVADEFLKVVGAHRKRKNIRRGEVSALHLSQEALDMHNGAVIRTLLHFHGVVSRLPAVAYPGEIRRGVVLRGHGLTCHAECALVPHGASNRDIAVGLHAEYPGNMPAPLIAGGNAVAINTKVKALKNIHMFLLQK